MGLYEPDPPSTDFTARLDELRRLISTSLDKKTLLCQLYTELIQKLEQRYDDERYFEDLESIVGALGALIDSGCLDNAEIAAACYKRSCYLAEHFYWSESTANLDKVITERKKSVDLTEPTKPLHPFYLSELGAAYLDRYERLGTFERDQSSQLKDLSEAQQLCRRSVDLLSDRYIDTRCRAQLAIVYLSCFERFEDPLDLASAERLISVNLLPPISPNNTNFGYHQYALSRYYSAVYKQNRLEEGLGLATKAASIALENSGTHPDPRYMCSLAECHVSWYHHTADKSALKRALHLYKLALGTSIPGWRVPRASPNERALCHSGIGAIFTELYKLFETISDLELAIEHNQKAVETTGWSHPDLSVRQVNLALSYLERYKRLGDLEDYRKADKIIILSADLITLMPLKPATNALRAAMLGIKMQREHKIDAYGIARRSDLGFYRFALSALPQVSWLGKDIALRQLSLTHQDIVTLAVDGAAWGIAGNHLAEAVEVLEEGRAITFRQLLQLRSDFEALLPSAPELASNMKATAIALQNGSFAKFSPDSGTVSTTEEMAQRQRDLANHWQTLLKTARMLPGMTNFLRARPFQELRMASRNGPVIILNCSDIRCDALIILNSSEDCHVLPLTHSSRADAEQMTVELRKTLSQVGRTVRESRHFTKLPVNHRAKSESALIGILARLWITVVQPVVDFLLLHHAQSKRIWWCPTGPYTSLPIHAAGLYASEDGPNITKFFKSSYIPTLETLLSNEMPFQHQRPKILGVGMPNTPGQVPLPGTKEELEQVRTQVTPLQQWVQLENTEATVSGVLAAIKDADWLHLACHGIQNIAEPLASSLILHDGTLQLRQIMQAAAKPGFVYLSACQTASGDRRMQDEAMHLAGGFLFAGFRAAIATMWSIDDRDGPTVASAVYQHLTRNGKVPETNEVCEALHEAIDQLRSQGVSPLRWVPFIHLGI